VPVAYAAGSAQSNAGLLLVGGDGGPNHMSVFIPGFDTFRVSDSSGMTAQSGCVDSVTNAVDCNAFGVTQMAAFLQDGDDTFNTSLQLPATVVGRDGNDSIDGGPLNDSIQGNVGNDTLHGEDGNDTLTDGDAFYGTGGNDGLYGDGGNDRLDGGSATTGVGGDVLDGGSDTDTLTYAQRTQPLTVTEDSHSNDGQVGEGDDVTGIEHLILGSKGDKATGDASANTIEGRNGNDSLNGGVGNDHVQGDNGNDSLIGGGGADTLSGGAGLDKADYSARTQRVTVTIGVGANDGAAGEKDNVLDDVEVVLGGSGSDILTGEDGANTLSGGAGADKLNGLGGDDNLNGGTGKDVLSGGSGDEVITGGPSPDKITGGSGDDVINAKDGSKDTIDCGTGSDRVTVDAIDVVSSNCEQVIG
jgi:Ca2+-binding RTX toxin-like protein